MVSWAAAGIITSFAMEKKIRLQLSERNILGCHAQAMSPFV
jgi:hypothetical protein